MGQISLSMIGAYEWRELSKRLRGAASRDFRTALRKRIQEAGKPALEEVKEAARNIPVHGDGHGGGTNRRRTYHSLQAGRRAAKAGRDVAKAASRAARRHAGLRDEVAASIKLQVTSKGIRFVADSRNMPESQRTLPRHLDSPKGWRHPVFGNREKWVHEQGKPYFAETLKKRAPEFRQSILDAMEDIKKQIED